MGLEMADCVLLVGNGINNIEGNNTWKDVISDLVAFIGATGQIKVEDKPFPLLYEEIMVESVKNNRKTESQVKAYIADTLRIFRKNAIHERIAIRWPGDILTTNYDYTIENAIMDRNIKHNDSAIIQESRYSLFRRSTFGKRSIWHVHGESNVPNSIMLGYDQYAGYLQQMRAYVVTGTGSSYKNYKFDPLVDRFRNSKIQNASWIDYFFTKDIHIIGFTLDFVEMEFWWLLTYRARCLYSKRYKIMNQITYYYPDCYAGSHVKGKLDFLKSSGVIPFSFPYSRAKKEDYYNQVFEYIEKRCQVS
jgi:hypothetical protein